MEKEGLLPRMLSIVSIITAVTNLILDERIRDIGGIYASNIVFIIIGSIAIVASIWARNHEIARRPTRKHSLNNVVVSFCVAFGICLIVHGGYEIFLDHRKLPDVLRGNVVVNGEPIVGAPVRIVSSDGDDITDGTNLESWETSTNGDYYIKANRMISRSDKIRVFCDQSIRDHYVELKLYRNKQFNGVFKHSIDSCESKH